MKRTILALIYALVIVGPTVFAFGQSTIPQKGTFTIQEALLSDKVGRLHTLAISGDNRHIAYASSYSGARPNLQCVVIDGQPGPPFPEVRPQGRGALVFSSDGHRVAYKALTGENGKWFVVVDATAGPLYDYVSNLTFSPDGKHLAYMAYVGENHFVVMDGQAGPPFVAADHLTFGPDSERVAYIATEIAKTGLKFLVDLDGQRGPQYDTIASLSFTPDSKHVIYTAQLNQKSFVVVDGRPAKEFKSYIDPVVSPDGTRIAYTIETAGNQYAAIEDGVVGAEYDRINCLTFSPDSKRLAYIAQESRKNVVVLDGQADPHFDAVSFTSLVFSPDSKHVAYLEKEFHKDSPGVWDSFWVVDGQPQRKNRASDSRPLIFSANGEHFAYATPLSPENGAYYMTVDGQAGRKYDEISDPYFDSDGSLRFIAKNGSGLIRVEYTPSH
jgi:WD40 repeat protein